VSATCESLAQAFRDATAPRDRIRFVLIAIARGMNQHKLQVIDYLREDRTSIIVDRIRVLIEPFEGSKIGALALCPWTKADRCQKLAILFSYPADGTQENSFGRGSASITLEHALISCSLTAAPCSGVL
jgi:hypothetical protein